MAFDICPDKWHSIYASKYGIRYMPRYMAFDKCPDIWHSIYDKGNKKIEVTDLKF